jgi:hypothetical protein
VPAKRKKWPVILGVLFIVAFVAAMLFTTRGNARFRCQVCMTFDGRTICRSGAATSRDEAVRIAADNACTDLTSGMTPFVQCRSQPPSRVTWKQ